jgi:hypothetical protein
MNYFTLFGLAILAFGLVKDYKKDYGQNTTAKILHAICLAILIASYAGSFRILGMLTRNFNKVRERFSVDVGIVPGQLHFVLYLLHSALAMTVIVVAYQMIKRNEKSRRLLTILLPILALLEVFSFYRGWIIDADDLGMNHAFIFLIGFLLIGGLTSIIIAIYKSKSMTTFFATIEKNQPTPNGEKSLNQPDSA